MELFNPDNLALTKYIFFTGKGGVGKTSVACDVKNENLKRLL